MATDREKKKSRLDNPELQAVLRSRIASTGKESACFHGIVSERQYYRWRKANPKAWRELKDSAMREYAACIRLKNPDILSLCVETAEKKLRDGDCRLSEVASLLRLLLDARKELNA